jgi:hypothetical protein
MPTYQPKPQKPKRGWLVPVIVAVALIFGFGMGAIKPPPAPVTIEKVVEKRVEVPVEKRVEVPVTPQACITALSKAGEIIDISGNTVGIMSDTLKAAVTWDSATITANTEKVKTETTKLKDITPGYISAREECQAGAE